MISANTNHRKLVKATSKLAIVLLFAWVTAHPSMQGGQADGAQASKETLENVSGEGCYAYGDNETPAQAKRAAQIIAQEAAVRSHRVFVQSNTRLKNFQVEEDVIQTASAAMLQNVKVEKEWKKESQEICVKITANLSPISAEELIKQRINAKDIAEEAANSKVLATAPGFGLRLWTNKSDGRFLEGERLIVSVSPERDGYLKLDYFQADGTVVHLVPNLFRGQAFVKAGQTYTFGDDASPEHFVIQGPYGDETIKAILSARPIEIPMESGQAVDNSRDYLKSLKSGTRGIGVVGIERSASLVTLSKTVSEYQKARK